MPLKFFTKYGAVALLLSAVSAHAQEAPSAVPAEPAAAPAESPAAGEASCRRLYSRISYKQNFSVVRKYVPGVVESAHAKVVELEQIKVKDIFPAETEVPDGFRAMKAMPKSNKVILKKYREAFDELMERRVAAGLFPRQELVAYRKWLREMYNGNAYPKIDSEQILKGIRGNEFLAEYFDQQFVRLYVVEGKGITISNVPHYLASEYPGLYSRIKGVAAAKGEKIGKFLYGWAKPVIAFGTAVPLYEMGTSFIAPLVNPVKKVGTDKTKEAGEFVQEQVSKLTTSRPDKATEKIAALQALQKEILDDKWKGLSRAKVRERMDEIEKGYLANVPDFHNVVLSIEKNFDEKWVAALKEKVLTIPSLRSSYDAKRQTLDVLTALTEKSGTPPTGDDLDKIAFWAAKLAESENEISDALVQWQFYRLHVGKEKLDPVMEKEYGRMYDDYVRIMDMENFRKKLAATMEPWITKLDSWEKGTKPSVEKPLPAPGKVPEVSPAAYPNIVP